MWWSLTVSPPQDPWAVVDLEVEAVAATVVPVVAVGGVAFPVEEEANSEQETGNALTRKWLGGRLESERRLWLSS